MNALVSLGQAQDEQRGVVAAPAPAPGRVGVNSSIKNIIRGIAARLGDGTNAVRIDTRTNAPLHLVNVVRRSTFRRLPDPHVPSAVVRFNMHPIAELCNGTIAHGAPLRIRFANDPATVNMYDDGTVVVIGCNTEQKASLAVLKLHKLVQITKQTCVIECMRTANLVFTASIGYSVDLHKLCASLQSKATLNTRVFPGLRIKLATSKDSRGSITTTVFHKGKLILVGCVNFEEANMYYLLLCGILDHHRYVAPGHAEKPGSAAAAPGLFLNKKTPNELASTTQKILADAKVVAEPPADDEANADSDSWMYHADQENADADVAESFGIDWDEAVDAGSAAKPSASDTEMDVDTTLFESWDDSCGTAD